MHRLSVWTEDAQFSRGASFVPDLNEKSSPAILQERGFRGALGDLDSHFRVNLDVNEAIGIQKFLNLRRRIGVCPGDCSLETLSFRFPQGRSQSIQSVYQSLDLRRQRLDFDTLHQWWRVCCARKEGRTGQSGSGQTNNLDPLHCSLDIRKFGAELSDDSSISSSCMSVP